ncbi:Conjugative transposon protein TcpC [Lactococcus chungangensis CAU 28 = DSM 22330]|uniref:Conjugative transposon protein TcpC n=2 Tax=Pseudolactococcus chungangensis TaxID=451457 RepID=A0A1K2HCJ5_9LACT|nr:conjugal transfer protein [Lactococcus chungangensis]SFZ74491.1 Conjugative transposon protein TcpC [Lactococcus chungangensis CAU 28 = DSM 22330]
MTTDMARTDILTSSIVRNLQNWNVLAESNSEFKVQFSVVQDLTEGEVKKTELSTHHVVVYVDKNGNLVIVQNATMDNKPVSSTYLPKQKENDGMVDSVMTEEINGFFKMFFKLYPKVIDKELAYYISNDALPGSTKDCVFTELVNPIYTMKDNKVTVVVTVILRPRN